MRSRKAKCPACGEQMTVPGNAPETRVACPHCRSAVTPTDQITTEIVPVQNVPNPLNLETAQVLLADILRDSQSKRMVLEQTDRDLTVLEARAKLVRQWLENKSLEDPQIQTHLIFQLRLYERLAFSPKGEIEICETARGDGILAASVRDVFAAAGWHVHFTRSEKEHTPGGRNIFSIGPGAMSDQVAVAHLALTLGGLNLQSVVDQNQANHPRLLIGGRLPLPKLTATAQIEIPAPNPSFPISRTAIKTPGTRLISS